MLKSAYNPIKDSKHSPDDSDSSSASRRSVCMIVQQRDVHGGIAAVLSHYYGSFLEQDFRITYIESYRDGSKFQKLTKALSCYLAFHKLLRTDPPKLVHIHASFGPSFYRKLPVIRMAYAKKIPVVIHIHGSALQELYYDASDRKKKLVRDTYAKCARMIVLSDEWKEKMSPIYPADRIRVVPNYSVEHADLAAKYETTRLQKKQVLYLGRFDDLKGINEMPEIIRLVHDKHPEVTFLLCGDGETEKVSGPIAELGLDGIVSLPGWVNGEQKEKALCESLLFFLPSHMEAMPVSVLEAMGYGLPIVSCKVGGIPKVVTAINCGDSDNPSVQTGNGFLTEPCDCAALAEAICRFVKDPTLWKSASANSLRIVHERFGLEKHLKSVEEIYRELL